MLDLSDGAPLPGELLEYRKTATMRAVLVDEPFQVRTLEGTMTGQPGDYLVVGVKGERYPCAADVLAASYQRVDVPKPQPAPTIGAAILEHGAPAQTLPQGTALLNDGGAARPVT